MRIVCWFVLAACALLLNLSASAATGNFELQVNDVSGLDSPWPLVGGLPFPEGEVRDPERIRIVNEEGGEVPAQIDVTATWRDGSIRWALAGIHASPQGEYRVEYGPSVGRSASASPLVLQETEGGALTVDTTAAVYEFTADRLLPESGRMGDTVFLAGSGDGAYLVDNRGRLARVAGALAEIETEILKQGPVRTVIRRAGWYVTLEGERVARAKAWFYFTAGSPFVRITHSIVFTEDTNELWVRDYGLDFRTPVAPQDVTFALHEPAPVEELGARGGKEYMETVSPGEVRGFANLFSGPYPGRQRLFEAPFEGDEIYMLQDDCPHFLEREFRAVIARVPQVEAGRDTRSDIPNGNLWVHSWLEQANVAGDWADGDYGGHGLTVVTPHLAQRFPKEIAFDAGAVRVALWSGRSGRELDFRAVTLVNEYWEKWANNAIHAFKERGLKRGPAIGTRVARKPSNAQGAARTHDVWLLPRVGGENARVIAQRAAAAAHPPLLQADPAWLCATDVFGFPMHPKDPEQFPEVEDAMRNHWEHVMHRHNQLRRTGFIDWGATVTLATAVRFFRLFPAQDYGFRFSSWILYARGGERRYYDFAAQTTRFVGDWRIVQWPGGSKRVGECHMGDAALPIYWGDGSGSGLYSGKTRISLHMDYYLTGDEYARELMRMVGDAYLKRWEEGTFKGSFSSLRTLSVLYTHTWDETFKEMAAQVANLLIDLDNPVGLNDDYRYGVYYKTGKELLWPLYLYYKATGDERARKAFLRGVDDKFRFFYSSNQTFRLFLFAEAYRMTGNRAYLRLAKLMVEQPFFSLFGHNVFLGAPAALHAIAHADKPIGPFPVLAVTRSPDPGSVVRSAFTGVGLMDHEFIEADTLPPIWLRKQAGKPVTLSVFVRVSDELDELFEPEAVVAHRAPNGQARRVENVRIVKQQRFKTKNRGRWHPRRWHFYVSLPEEAEAGTYRIEFPQAATIIVLESDAEEVKIDEMD